MAHKRSGFSFSHLRMVAQEAHRHRKNKGAYVRIDLELEPGVSPDLIDALKCAFIPQTETGLVHVGALRIDDRDLCINTDTDIALIVVASEHGPGAAAARAFQNAGVTCAIVAQTSLDFPIAGIEGRAISYISASSSEVLLDKLASWLVSADVDAGSLATNFPFTLQTFVSRAIETTSSQNAVIGLLPFNSNADLPVMVTNQARMALDIAEMYGQPLGIERLVEAAGVVGTAVVSRAIARRVCKLVPSLKMPIRAAVAYGGTTALGFILRKRFEISLPQTAKSLNPMDSQSVRPGLRS